MFLPETLKTKKVFIAPLDWGLGHAARIIPIINKLEEKGAEVVIGASGKSFALLHSEFPDLKIYPLPSVSISYGKNRRQFLLKLCLQIPAFFQNIYTENRQLRKINQKELFDLIISDNRYGIRLKKVRSIFITHQVFPVFPGVFRIIQKPLHAWHIRKIKKFSECWIPDYKGKKNLSGNLSRQAAMPPNFRYIGILSRFSTVEKKSYPSDYKVVAIISGPEPQRTLFEKQLIEQLKNFPENSLLLRGKPEKKYHEKKGKLHIINHLKSDEMKGLLLAADFIIARAGYSTIMDLVCLQKKAILVPTPGQPEQEYLAEHLKNSRLFIFQTQKKLNISKGIEKLKELKNSV